MPDDPTPSDLRRAPVLVDRREYRLAVGELRNADAGGRTRWWPALGAFDLLRITEADGDGRIAMTAREFCLLWGLDEATWADWSMLLVGAHLLAAEPGGYRVTPLPRLVGPARRGVWAPIWIDPLRYRIAATRLRLAATGWRWWSALGAWGVLRMLDGDPSSRLLPYSAGELATAWQVDPRSWRAWIDLLEAAELLHAVDGGGYRLARLRARMPPGAR